MTKRKLFLTLCFILQSACNALGGPATSLPVTETVATPSATASPLPTILPSATVEPTLPSPPAIAPEFFTQVKVLHEYWPAIRKGVGLWEETSFGKSQTAWAYSPDGRYLAVAGCDVQAGDGTVFSYIATTCEKTMFDTVAHAFLVILDAKTETIIATLPETGQELTVRWLAFTPDGNKLVYGLDTYKIKVWDIRSATLESVIAEELPVAPSFAISPNGKWMTILPVDQYGLVNRINIWDIAEKKLAFELPEPEDAIFFSADGQRLLVFFSAFIEIFETKTWQKLSQQPLRPDGDANVWTLSPDLSLLAVCSTYGKAGPTRIWNTSTAELLETLKGKSGKCGRVIFSPDSRLLLQFNEHGAGPVIWEVDGWKLVQANPNITNFVGSGDEFVDRMQFSQDGRSILVGTFKRLTLYGLP